MNAVRQMGLVGRRVAVEDLLIQVDRIARVPRPQRVAWLDRQDLSKAEAFWRENLKGFDAPTPLVIDHASAETGGDIEAAGESEMQLSEETTNRLQSLARQHGLSLGQIAATLRDEVVG